MIINSVIGGAGGTSEILPDSSLYTTLSYIETDGATAYINTDLSVNTTYKLTFEVQLTDPSINAALFGTRFSSSANRQVAFCPNNTTGNLISYQCSTGNTAITATGFTWDSTKKYTIVFENDKITVDGTVHTTGTTGTGFYYVSLYPIRLFNFYTGTTQDTRFWKGRLYSLIVGYSSGNGIIRDFIPVQRISDSKYGLWDKVGGTFYVGTGTFTGA